MGTLWVHRMDTDLINKKENKKMDNLNVDNYEIYVNKVNNERNKIFVSFLTIGEICLEAKETLGNKTWEKWLNDGRVNIQLSQARKYIAVYKQYNEKKQSTVFFENNNIEHLYLLTRIKDNDRRIEAENLVEKGKLSVKQTRNLIKVLKKDKDISCQEAIEKINNAPEKPQKEKPQMVSIEKYNELKKKYEALLQEKKELENKIKLIESNKSAETVKNVTGKSTNPITKSKNSAKVLKEPVETASEEGTINKEKRTIVVDGKELPIPMGVNIETQNLNLVKLAAKNAAENKGKQNIKSPAIDTIGGTIYD